MFGTTAVPVPTSSKVERQLKSTTRPSSPGSILTKSPIRIWPAMVMNRPANRFDNVSCIARATARPPTPRAASIGRISTPRPFSTTSRPNVMTTSRTTFWVSAETVAPGAERVP